MGFPGSIRPHVFVVCFLLVSIFCCGNPYRERRTSAALSSQKLACSPSCIYGMRKEREAVLHEHIGGWDASGVVGGGRPWRRPVVELYSNCKSTRIFEKPVMSARTERLSDRQLLQDWSGDPSSTRCLWYFERSSNDAPHAFATNYVSQ